MRKMLDSKKVEKKQRSSSVIAEELDDQIQKDRT